MSLDHSVYHVPGPYQTLAGGVSPRKEGPYEQSPEGATEGLQTRKCYPLLNQARFSEDQPPFEVPSPMAEGRTAQRRYWRNEPKRGLFRLLEGETAEGALRVPSLPSALRLRLEERLGLRTKGQRTPRT